MLIVYPMTFIKHNITLKNNPELTIKPPKHFQDGQKMVKKVEISPHRHSNLFRWDEKMKEEFEHLKFHSVLCVSNTLNIDVTEMTAGENFHLICSPEFSQSDFPGKKLLLCIQKAAWWWWWVWHTRQPDLEPGKVCSGEYITSEGGDRVNKEMPS